MMSGCIAVNVGKPTVHTHIDTHFETASVPSATHVETARAILRQDGTRVVVGIEADARDEFARTRWEETTTVRVQKRLAFGLFPGASETYLMPKGALDSAVFLSNGPRTGGPQPCWLYQPPNIFENYVCAQLVLGIGTCGLGQAAGTVHSLLAEPFAGWSCGHGYTDKAAFVPRKHYRNSDTLYSDPSGSPKLRALLQFSEEERTRMGVKTSFDASPGTFASVLAHFGLAGFHKYLAVFVEPPKAGARSGGGVETNRRQMEVKGPWEAELSIPALHHTQRARAERGAKSVEFRLPSAERTCLAEAVVSFRPGWSGEGVSDTTREALDQLDGKMFRFDVTLQPGQPRSPQPTPPAHSASVPPPAKEKVDGLYEVRGIRRSPTGQYEVRVSIADRSKTFDIGWAIEGEVRQKIREDFANRHPGTGIQYVREIVEWETEEEGTVLVYRGWAFSARPVADGWRYDDESRRGRVRLRISEGMPAEEAKRWARENIAAIVGDKNAVLKAGMAPPEGALYRSLGETLENGVLTVEFEAVE